ncbi:hypothetical protein HMPREF9554_03053 [Treponema phagedenis F0421]|nr:hypothetical protein HMPREF9554_03053 [Treponema phagedenis F0421]
MATVPCSSDVLKAEAFFTYRLRHSYGKLLTLAPCRTLFYKIFYVFGKMY